MNIWPFIMEYAKKHGITQIGVCSADPFWELRNVLDRKNYLLESFVEQDIQKRMDPSLILPQAKSIVVFAYPYHRQMAVSPDEALRGRLSLGAIGEDYHRILSRILEGLGLCLAEKIEAHYKVYVDTGPLVDRMVAVRAGLGYIGKNGSLHCWEAGSMFFLGYLVTDKEIQTPPMGHEQGGCGSCRKCIEHCPSGALTEEGLEYTKCISYITQKKGELSKEERTALGRQIYGCDVCQLVCPHNQKINQFPPVTSLEEAMPDIEGLMAMSNRQFYSAFGSTAAGWRGKKTLQRNALAVLSNMGTAKARQALERYAKDDRLWVRQAALQYLNES